MSDLMSSLGEPFREVDPPIPDSIFRLLQRMTEKNPDNRFSTCTELLEVLEVLRDEILAPREPAAVRSGRPKSKKSILQRLGIKRSNPD